MTCGANEDKCGQYCMPSGSTCCTASEGTYCDADQTCTDNHECILKDDVSGSSSSDSSGGDDSPNTLCARTPRGSGGSGGSSGSGGSGGSSGSGSDESSGGGGGEDDEVCGEDNGAASLRFPMLLSFLAVAIGLVFR